MFGIIPFVTYEIIKEFALESTYLSACKTKLNNIYSTASIIFQASYITLIQKFRKNVRKLDQNKYEISYVIAGRLYKLIVCPKRGPLPMISVKNENGIDVTDNILQYLGPNYDWHKILITPEQLGYKSLTFEYPNETSIFFPEKTILNIHF